jgi:DNA-binding response OmpR family regulator
MGYTDRGRGRSLIPVSRNLIVISRSAEIRESFNESYALLGYEVSVFEDIIGVIKDLNILDPDHVIMDIDSLPRKWKVVASGLKLAQKKITIILIASSMTFEEANEALILGVSGIIIKPFFPEVHLKRAYDIIHRKLRAKGKRAYPRFYAGSEFKGEFFMHTGTAGTGYIFEVVNLSEVGAAVRSKDPQIAPELQPNYVIHEALLQIDGQEFRVSVRVAFRRGGLIGFRLNEIDEGKANFVRLIQKLSLKAFGASGIQGRW